MNTFLELYAVFMPVVVLAALCGVAHLFAICLDKLEQPE